MTPCRQDLPTQHNLETAPLQTQLRKPLELHANISVDRLSSSGMCSVDVLNAYSRLLLEFSRLWNPDGPSPSTFADCRHLFTLYPSYFGRLQTTVAWAHGVKGGVFSSVSTYLRTHSQCRRHTLHPRSTRQSATTVFPVHLGTSS